jgi:hypothetical protein
MAQPFPYPSDYTTPGPSPSGIDPQGMIQVPDDIRRLHSKLLILYFSVYSRRVRKVPRLLIQSEESGLNLPNQDRSIISRPAVILDL